MTSLLRQLLIAGGAVALLFWLRRDPRVRQMILRGRDLIRRRPLLGWGIIAALAAVPMLYMTALVARYAVDVPLLDDWEMARAIIKYHLGELKFSDLFEQQQEARTLLPR